MCATLSIQSPIIQTPQLSKISINLSVFTCSQQQGCSWDNQVLATAVILQDEVWGIFVTWSSRYINGGFPNCRSKVDSYNREYSATSIIQTITGTRWKLSDNQEFGWLSLLINIAIITCMQGTRQSVQIIKAFRQSKFGWSRLKCSGCENWGLAENAASQKLVASTSGSLFADGCVLCHLLRRPFGLNDGEASTL